MAIFDEQYTTESLLAEDNGVPDGDYDAIISEVKIVQSRDPANGNTIRFRYDITGPSHEGRCVFDNLMPKHKNETKSSMDRARLGKIQKVCGLVETPKDTSEFEGKSIGISVKNNGDFTNVKNVFPLLGQVRKKQPAKSAKIENWLGSDEESSGKADLSSDDIPF